MRGFLLFPIGPPEVTQAFMGGPAEPKVRDLLGCKYMRSIAVDGLPPNLVVLCDADGALKSLNRNNAATDLCGVNLPEGEPIFGRAFVVAQQDDALAGLTDDEFFQLAARIVGDEHRSILSRHSIPIEGG